jgi:hypothetical protein
MFGRKSTEILSTEPVLALCGRTRKTALVAYEAFVRDGLSRVHQEHAAGTVPGTWLD